MTPKQNCGSSEIAATTQKKRMKGRQERRKVYVTA